MNKAVIFDFDGVLVDSVYIHTSALVKVLRPYVELTEEYFKEFSGRSTFDILDLLKDKYNITEDTKKLKAQKDQIVRESLDKIKLYDGVPVVLEKLKNKGLKMAVATSGETERTNKILINNNVREYFSAVIGFEMVKKAKPAPDIFLEAASRLGVESGEAVVVEDASAGVEAAKAAGMKCIAITNTVRREKLIKADFVIDNIKEVLRII